MRKQTQKLLELMPELPYAGTSGFSGTDTSENRARSADADGKTALRQKQAIEFISGRGHFGSTWKELADVLRLHHGSASGVLSVLHKTGHLVRLKETRDACKVYVSPNFVANRPSEVFGRKKSCPHCGGNL